MSESSSLFAGRERNPTGSLHLQYSSGGMYPSSWRCWHEFVVAVALMIDPSPLGVHPQSTAGSQTSKVVHPSKGARGVQRRGWAPVSQMHG